jgi:hypothetical protein
MSLKRIGLAVALAAAVGVPAAWAGTAEVAAYGTATSGSLNVTSGVLVLGTSAELKGVWLDDTRACTEKRRLRVTVEIFYTPDVGEAQRIRRTRAGRVANCAEGGPNFGFNLRASRNGLACPDGTWKPGGYSFLTTTKDTRSGLEASASLLWQKEEGTC